MSPPLLIEDLRRGLKLSAETHSSGPGTDDATLASAMLSDYFRERGYDGIATFVRNPLEIGSYRCKFAQWYRVFFLEQFRKEKGKVNAQGLFIDLPYPTGGCDTYAVIAYAIPPSSAELNRLQREIERQTGR